MAGLLEGIGIGAWLLWMAAAAVVLKRRNQPYHALGRPPEAVASPAT
jgi:hypothetical protein